MCSRRSLSFVSMFICCGLDVVVCCAVEKSEEVCERTLLYCGRIITNYYQLLLPIHPIYTIKHSILTALSTIPLHHTTDHPFHPSTHPSTLLSQNPYYRYAPQYTHIYPSSLSHNSLLIHNRILRINCFLPKPLLTQLYLTHKLLLTRKLWLRYKLLITY